MENYKIAVAGTGYVGLSIATLLSQHHHVTAVDIIPEKVEMINNRKSPIQDDYIEKYLAEKDLDVAVELYKKGMSLKAIGDELLLNPIKVRKLLITAEVYKSEIAEKVKSTFDEYRETQDYKTALFSTATTFQLSRASVTSYLLYEKGVYFPPEEKDKISVGAERQRRYRAVKLLRKERTEEKLWNAVVIYGGVKFWTFSGLPFTYELRKGRSGEFTRELWIDRREHSKSLAWSSVLLAFEKVKDGKIKVERPKDLGDIRGVTYIYSLFLRFGLIEAAKNDKSQKSEK